MKENLSALMDGELDEQAAANVLQSVSTDAELKSTWQAYHLIGDAMRGGALLHVDVREQVTNRLQDEPTVLAPRPHVRRRLVTARYAVAASVALAGVVGWYTWQSQPADPGLMAQAVPAASLQVAVTPPANQPYLQAHQESGFNDGLSRASLVQPAAQGGH